MKISMDRQEQNKSIKTGIFSSRSFSYTQSVVLVDFSEEEMNAMSDGKLDKLELCKVFDYESAMNPSPEMTKLAALGGENYKDFANKLKEICTVGITVDRVRGSGKIVLSSQNLEDAVNAEDAVVTGLKLLKEEISKRAAILEKLAGASSNGKREIEI
jgi:hypothetical protein